MLYIDERKYQNIDADSLMFLRHFDEPKGSEILEVGAFEEESAHILVDNGYSVWGHDLRERDDYYMGSRGYYHTVGDFVDYHHVHARDEDGNIEPFDAAFSTSAIEHFGLNCYGQVFRDENYDIKAMRAIYEQLKHGGMCYITVPYGRQYCVEPDWRVYDAKALQERIVGDFYVVKRVFFMSGDCTGLPVHHNDRGINIVSSEDADTFHCPTHPHLTVFLKMRKT